jgi:hypothetical protein
LNEKAMQILTPPISETTKPLKYAGTASSALGLSKEGLKRFARKLLEIEQQRVNFKNDTVFKLKDIADYIHLDSVILIDELNYLRSDAEIEKALTDLKIIYPA